MQENLQSSKDKQSALQDENSSFMSQVIGGNQKINTDACYA